jgi:hypothetical protein
LEACITKSLTTAGPNTIFYGIPDRFNAVSRASSDELEITNAELVEADP